MALTRDAATIKTLRVKHTRIPRGSRAGAASSDCVFRWKWNTESGGSGTSIPAEVEHRFREVEHGFREVEHRFRRKWNRGSGGRERSSVA